MKQSRLRLAVTTGVLGATLMAVGGNLQSWELASPLSLLGTTAHAQAAQLPPLQRYGNVEYVSGGFGQPMTEAFRAAQPNFPLSLVFAEDAGNGTWPFVADVNVRILNESGNAVLEANNVGPYLLVKLPSGRYTVEATYQGVTRTTAVTVNDQSSAQYSISWPKS